MEPLPEIVSNDGREVWDWADRFSDQVHKAYKIRELSADIRRATTECGNCTKWITSACPRERHNNTTGRKEGPSTRGAACVQFTLKPSAAKRLDERRAELNALATPQPPR